MTAPKKASEGVEKKSSQGLSIGDAIVIVVFLAFSLFWLWLIAKGMKPTNEMSPYERKQEEKYWWLEALVFFGPPVLACLAIKKIIWKD